MCFCQDIDVFFFNLIEINNQSIGIGLPILRYTCSFLWLLFIFTPYVRFNTGQAGGSLFSLSSLALLLLSEASESSYLSEADASLLQYELGSPSSSLPLSELTDSGSLFFSSLLNSDIFSPTFSFLLKLLNQIFCLSLHPEIVIPDSI